MPGEGRVGWVRKLRKVAPSRGGRRTQAGVGVANTFNGDVVNIRSRVGKA